MNQESRNKGKGSQASCLTRLAGCQPAEMSWKLILRSIRIFLIDLHV
jgi:hypothetical protein